MTANELLVILDRHKKWLNDEDGGSGAVLSGADLSGAVLSRADLSGAVLRGADLYGAVLRGAVLRGADLRGAVLRGAVLRALYPDMTLAEMYNDATMPPVLRAAHEQNDRAVMEAYGFDVNAKEDEIIAGLMQMYEQLTTRRDEK